VVKNRNKIQTKQRLLLTRKKIVFYLLLYDDVLTAKYVFCMSFMGLRVSRGTLREQQLNSELQQVVVRYRVCTIGSIIVLNRFRWFPLPLRCCHYTTVHKGLSYKEHINSTDNDLSKHRSKHPTYLPAIRAYRWWHYCPIFIC